MRQLVGILVVMTVGWSAVAEDDLAPRVVDGKVIFSCKAPDAREVYLAGSFNGWDAQRDLMERRDDGIWKLELPLTAGRHEYKFVIDGAWTVDPNAVETTPDPYGGKNGVVSLTGEGSSLKIVRAAAPEPEKTIVPYLSGRYVSELLTRKAEETGDRYRLIRPEHDVTLDFTVSVGGNVEAWAETRMSTLDDDPNLRLGRAHATVKAQFGEILAFYNELAVDWEEPRLIGKIGEFEEPFGESARGITFASQPFTPHRVSILGFYADDENEVDRAALRVEAGRGWKLGATLVRYKPIQAIPVLGFSIPLSEEWDTDNFAFIPGSWWRQFYPQYYDSTGSDTRSNDSYYYFHFKEFASVAQADMTYEIDAIVPLLGEKLSVFGEYAFRSRPSFQGTSDMHTTSAGPVVDSTQVVFNEKYDSHSMLAGLRFHQAKMFSGQLSYQIDKDRVETNLGGGVDDPVVYEPQTSTVKGKILAELGSLFVLGDLRCGLKTVLERCELIDGFTYGDHQSFYDYLRVDRYGYVDNFYDLYFNNAIRTATIYPELEFTVLDLVRTAMGFKWKRYTCQRLSPSDVGVARRDYNIDTGEFLGEITVPLTPALSALVNYRLQTYASSQDDYLFYRHHFANTYAELGYSVSPNVRITAGYGVDPWDRTDTYRRKKGREDFLAERLWQLTSRPNYGRHNDEKMGLIFDAEEALERETRFSLAVEVDF